MCCHVLSRAVTCCHVLADAGVCCHVLSRAVTCCPVLSRAPRDWLSSSSFMSCSSSFASGLSSLYIHARVCGGIRVVLFSFSRSSGILSSVLNSCFSRRAHSRGRRLDDGHRLRSAERIRPAVNRAHASQDVRGAHAPHGHAPHADDPRAVNTPGHHQPSRVVAAQHSTRCI